MTSRLLAAHSLPRRSLSTRLLPTAVASLLALASLAAAADEGMWTFDSPPLAAIQQQHGVALSARWLQQLQKAAVNFGGASASFVSSQGLVLTNHHVARGCIARLSTPERDLDGHGFLARTQAEELRCPGTVLKVLQSSDDVSDSVRLATSAAADDDATRNQSRKRVIAKLERDCQQNTRLHCQVVALYGGARYALYRYKEWDDVRLVFAPDAQAANFGGDDDNFVYPRFALDFALARVYENGKPAKPTGVLKLASKPLAEGDLVFVAGHPGSTDRLRTQAQLRFARDVDYPRTLARLEAQQALLHAYAKRSPEAARQAADAIAGVENRLKAKRGEYAALRDPEVMARKEAEEARLRAAWTQRNLPGDPWALVEASVARHAERFDELTATEYTYGSLLSLAGLLVDLAQQRPLPEDQRLAAWRDSELVQNERKLRAKAPFYPELETVRLAWALGEAKKVLGDSHPFVAAALGSDTPEAAAQRLVRGTQLADPAVRESLMRGGQAAIEASTDPMIVLARTLAPQRLALAHFKEEALDTPAEKAAAMIGQARYALGGANVPPDATGTLRLSYGTVKGYSERGIRTPWKTTWSGLLDRADSFDDRMPFTLPTPVATARAKLNPRIALNFVSTADIIGGNSGSPVVNAKGELVGLIFDGNLASLGGRYLYRDESARAVAVHVDAILQALETVYGAPQLAKEIRGGR